jgi:hypothetical protein
MSFISAAKRGGVDLADAVERQHRVVGDRVGAHRVGPRRERLGGAAAAQLGPADPVLRLALGPVVVVDRHRGDLLPPVADGLGVVAGAEGAPAQPPQRLGAHVAGGELDRQRLERGGDLGVVAEVGPLLGLAQERVVGVAVGGVGGGGGAVAIDRRRVIAVVRVRAAGLVRRAHGEILVARGGARGDRLVEPRRGLLAVAGLEQALGPVVARDAGVGRRAIGRGQRVGVGRLRLGVAHAVEQRLGAGEALGDRQRRLRGAGLGQRVEPRGGLGGPRRQRIVDGDRPVQRGRVGARVVRGLERLGAAEPRLRAADAVGAPGQVVAVVRGDRGRIAGGAQQIADQQLGVGADDARAIDAARQIERAGGVVREVAGPRLLIAEVVGQQRQRRAGAAERVGGGLPAPELGERDARQRQRAAALGGIGGGQRQRAERAGGGGPVLPGQRGGGRRAGEVRRAHVLGQRRGGRAGRRRVDRHAGVDGGRGDRRARWRDVAAVAPGVVPRARRRPREYTDEEPGLGHDRTLTTPIATGKFRGRATADRCLAVVRSSNRSAHRASRVAGGGSIPALPGSRGARRRAP